MLDPNGTRFHLLLGRDDWASCTDQAGRALGVLWGDQSPPGGEASVRLEWNEARHELTLQPRIFRFVARAGDNRPRVADRRGAGRDVYGNWYWIANSRTEILVNSSGSKATNRFWAAGGAVCAPGEQFGDFGPQAPVGPPEPVVLGGLAVTSDHYLVAGTIQPKGILVFDLHAGGEPRQICWPDDVPFAPFDMAAAPGGGVWILDRENACYWALDRNFNVVGPPAGLPDLPLEDFQPTDGSESRRADVATFPGSFPLNYTPPGGTTRDPIAIEALPDGTGLVLDHDPTEEAHFSCIYRYEWGAQKGEPVCTDIVLDRIEQGEQEGFKLAGHDIAYVPAHAEDDRPVPARLFVVSQEGNQSFAFDFVDGDTFRLQPVEEYLPMRLFGGKALVSAGNQAHYDIGDRWVPLAPQPRPRYVEEGTLLTSAGLRAFDGREPDCVWHRLMVDACIPPDTSIRVWSRAANEQRDLAGAAWQEEPTPYRRGDGSELPYVREPGGASSQDYATWELLFQKARGRYMQLRIKLVGSGRATPRVRALRAYYPRFSYLEQYLPAVYREEPGPASFLDRFLANVEGISTSIESRIAAVQMLFDVRSAPPETLEWLAGWFGVVLDPAWDERTRRLFIEHAVDFFQWRGTMRGLQTALWLALNECPDDAMFAGGAAEARKSRIRLVEKYRTRSAPAVVFGDPVEASGLPRIEREDTQNWRPEDGGEALNERYRAALWEALERGRAACKRGAPAQAQVCDVVYTQVIASLELAVFPLERPRQEEGAGKGDVWQQFAQDTLGFVPAFGSDQEARWRDFLARRYRRIGDLNRAYGTQLASFQDAWLPRQLPPNGAPLADWYEFHTVALPMRGAAHRFTVLLPVPEDRSDYVEMARRKGIAERVVNMEKPAHTIFDVKFYWGLFRVGDVRLGEDTLLDQGSRSPQLMSPMVLGHGYLAEGYLAALDATRPSASPLRQALEVGSGTSPGQCGSLTTIGGRLS